MEHTYHLRWPINSMRDESQRMEPAIQLYAGDCAAKRRPPDEPPCRDGWPGPLARPHATICNQRFKRHFRMICQQYSSGVSFPASIHDLIWRSRHKHPTCTSHHLGLRANIIPRGGSKSRCVLETGDAERRRVLAEIINFLRCAWSSVKSSGEGPRGPFPYCRAHAWTVRPTRVRRLSLSQPQPTSKTFRQNIWGSVRYLSLTWKADVCSCQPICINFGFRDNSEMWSHDSYLEPKGDRW